MKSHFQPLPLLSSVMAVSSLLLSSCVFSDLPSVSVVQDFGEEGIPPGIVFDLSTSPQDSAALSDRLCDIILTLRYTKNCRSREVIFNIEQNSLSHTKPDSSQVTFHLFSPSGRALGKGSYGVFEVSDTIRKGYKVPDGYVVSATSPLPQSATEGVKSLGLIIKSPSH